MQENGELEKHDIKSATVGARGTGCDGGARPGMNRARRHEGGGQGRGQDGLDKPEDHDEVANHMVATHATLPHQRPAPTG